MADVPNVSGPDVVKARGRLGFGVVRQRGSHVVLRKGDRDCVVPLHKSLAKGTSRGILKQADVTIEQFLAALRD